MIIVKRLTQEKPIIFESSEEKILNINTITLESTDEKYPIDVFCENKRKKETFKICSLKKDSQEMYSSNIMLDLHDFKDKYEFYLKTKCKKVLVNIIGCYEQEEDEEESEKLPEKEEKNFVKEKKEKNVEKKEKEKKKKKIEKEKKNKSSESDSESNDDNDLEDNRPNVSLVELLNKKRKEEPQEIKPLTLKNLVKDKNKDNGNNNEMKRDKKENKDKDKTKDKNSGNKFINKDKKVLKK